MSFDSAKFIEMLTLMCSHCGAQSQTNKISTDPTGIARTKFCGVCAKFCQKCIGEGKQHITEDDMKWTYLNADGEEI
jgi:hypothetical protein